jgi:predicted CopG family antitoxin
MVYYSEKRDQRDCLNSEYTVKFYFCVYIHRYMGTIHRYMGTKTISIRDDTYDLLKNVKREGENFSDTIDRLLKKEKRDISVYFGALENDDLLEGLAEDSR